MADSVHALHVDDDVLVLLKPSGLLCVPGRGADKQDCLSNRAQQHWPGALIVHRLDQATSGLVVMARNPIAQRTLSDAFAQRQVHKRYHALVRGLLPEPTGTDGWGLIDLPLIADWPNRPLQKVDWELGKPSQTRWRVLAHSATHNTTLLELHPITGRSHQLRLHLAAQGHPILGDMLYADPTTQAMAPRLMLHATELGFAHPVSGQWMQWRAEPAFGLP